MKLSNPKNISWLTSLIVSLGASLLYLLSSYILKVEISLIILLVFPLVLGPLSYFLLNILISRFIWDKIKLIYKNIHTLKLPKKKGIGNTHIDNNIIEKANDEVMMWSKKQTDEVEQLKKMESYRREFIGNVSHELKTPIFNIQGYILTLLDGALEDATINRQYLLRTEKSIDRMVTIINDLDVIAMMDAGELKLNFKKFDFKELVNEVFDFMEIKCKEKNINLFISEKTDKAIFAMADRESIKQVLINLIENALKYSNEGGRIKVSFYDMDQNYLVEISDNGIGIDEDDLKRIFERFYRTTKARNLKQSGSGLGLSIVKHIIEAHNQTINVRSTPNVGSTFAFTIKKAD